MEVIMNGSPGAPPWFPREACTEPRSHTDGAGERLPAGRRYRSRSARTPPKRIPRTEHVRRSAQRGRNRPRRVEGGAETRSTQIRSGAIRPFGSRWPWPEAGRCAPEINARRPSRIEVVRPICGDEQRRVGKAVRPRCKAASLAGEASFVSEVSSASVVRRDTIPEVPVTEARTK
jgi:hypothetical protein